MLLGQPHAAAQEDWHFQIDDPRPVATVARNVQGLCKCIVTYEDPLWTREQVVDVTALRENGRLDQPVFNPASQPSDFWFLLPPSDRLSTELSESVRAALEHVRRNGNPGFFSVRQRGNIYHITPASGSVLDAQVSLPATSGREADLVGALIRAVSDAWHTPIVVANTGLGTRIVEMSAANEPAESVLTRLLTMGGIRRSWQLLYDFGSQRYMLDIYIID
jgi:hypothetical protein